MNWVRVGIITILMGLPSHLWGQTRHQEHPVGGESSIAPPRVTEKSKLNAFLKAGHVSGHVRNFTMATINQGALTDYWANATGGAIHYESAPIFGHLQVGVKGIFTFNTGSSDLTNPDPLSGKAAKWEVELFDVRHPEEKRDLDRLEELYLKYNFGQGSFVEVGKFDLDTTPLLNRRDGRMKPFVFQGIWAQWHANAQHHLQGGWIHGVSPRAMTSFFAMNEAIGLNNQGKQPDGTAAAYHEAAHSQGVGVVGYRYEYAKGAEVSVWNFHLHRLTNLSWLETHVQRGHWLLAGQFVYQRAGTAQRSLAYAQRYMQPGEVGMVAAIRIGQRRANWELTGNYLHSFGKGRFLWPRELGRERLFTSMPRSWVEGLGDTDVFTVVGRYHLPLKNDNKLSADLRCSTVFAPAPTQYRVNKYGVRSYYQVNAAVKYDCFGHWDGLSVQLLYLYRGTLSAQDATPETVINQYQMHQLNLITNITF